MIEDDLVEFENNSKVLEYRYDYKNIFIWPYIRNILMYRANIDRYGYMPSQVQHVKIKDNYENYIKYNSYNLPKKDILFIMPSNDYVEKNGRLCDYLIDDFVRIDLKKQAKMIEYYSRFDFKKLQSEGIPISTDVFIRKIIKYEGKKHKVSNKEIKIINEFIKYLKKNIPFYVEEGVYGTIKETAIRTISEFPAYYKYYNKLLDIVQPKVVFCNCGMYGQERIKVFNDYGIITAEYQHGSIDCSYVYMYGKDVAENKEYREYMPKYFLTWGEYWTYDKNIPSNIYKIGNPGIQEKIDKYKKNNLKSDSSSNILIITGIIHEWYIEFIDYILNNLPSNFKVIVKLHPLYPETKKYYEPFIHNERVKVVSDGLVYDYFSQCSYVVGDISTALYEAAAVGKSVFIIDTEFTRKHLSYNFGTWIKNGKQFVEEMDNNSNKFCREDFFAENWKQNYLRFLKEIVYCK